MKTFTIRLIRTLLTLWGVVTLTFFLGRLKGDPVSLMLPVTAPIEDFERVRAQMGLDQPLPVQYSTYLGDVLHGDLGQSIAYNRPVTDVIVERIPATLELGIPALVLSTLLSIPLGVLAAVKRNRPLDRIIMSLSLMGHSIPSFFIGIVLILLFSVQLGWLPSFGRGGVANLVLPILTLTIYPLAFLVRLTRSSMLDVLHQTYISTAYAKGLKDRQVVFVHALKNALIPVITIIGIQVAGIIAGSAIVETVFSWPGMGWLAVKSIGSRDYPVIQGIVLMSAFAFSLTNLAVDLVYVMIDPRIRE
jgi:ABC-type dipeptide/oligopeptide/nickel transport system permease component